MASRGRSAQTGRAKKAEVQKGVHCLSIRGNEAVRRLAEIEANLVRSPLTRLQIHRHEAEARHLRDAIYGPTKRGGDRGNQYTGGKVAKRHGDVLPESDSLAAQTESTEARKRSVQRSVRLCKLLSAEECDRLEGTAVENCDKDLFAIADIGDIQQRTAVIDALSDAEKPAPSLYEAKCRAGIAPLAERDPEKEADRKAHLLFRALFEASPDLLERFLRRVGTEQPDFVDIATEVVKRLTERRGESCACLSSKRLRAVPATRGSPLNRGRSYERYSERSRNQTSSETLGLCGKQDRALEAAV